MNVKAEVSDKAAAKGTAECRSMTGYAMAKGEYGEVVDPGEREEA